MTERPWCEQCGEAPQEVRLNDVGLCGDCFGPAFIEQTKGFFWNTPCGRPLFNKSGRMVAVCVEPYGVEHYHGDIQIHSED